LCYFDLFGLIRTFRCISLGESRFIMVKCPHLYG
jgi:hypothetical protein